MYAASRGGHAPGHLRDIFAETYNWRVRPWWEAFRKAGDGFFFNAKFQAKWDSWDAKQRAKWVTGQLWNCTDIMPSELCDELDIAPGSTYARGVRRLRADLN